MTLFNHKDGLVVLSGTINDLFGKLFKLNKLDYIKELFKKFNKDFYNNFYLEIQRHHENDEKNYEDFLISISSELEIPLISSQEIFYINEEMAEAHDALICVGEKHLLTIKIEKNIETIII